MGEIRQRRIESAIKEIVGTMILRHDIKDPRLNDLVCITDVSISKDTKHARVYVSYFGEPEICTTVVETLNHAAGFIQVTIAKRLQLRNTPVLEFFEDHSIEKGFRITQKMRDMGIKQSAPDDSTEESSS